MLLNPRQKRAIQQTEKVHVEQLVSNRYEPEVGDLNHWPDGPTKEKSRKEIPLDILFHLSGIVARGEAHVGEKHKEV